ncbi:response regulator transcription factor [Anatilimnocola floriformis]|uniref:response regulator transcription factor n=1 Tax=Anatilimnocola floriformis TaxID=2948575 RepID=UPI0020C59ACE|nr:LuxR C-terminal-related transcriptional regulator [Anatilimnocola floriformis]
MTTAQSHLLIVSANSLLHHSLGEIGNELAWGCDHFRSGQEFLANYQPRQDNCLLVDLDLREMSGIELLQNIRQRAWSIPALVTQAWPATSLVVEAMNERAGGFLDQPFSPQSVQHAVNQLFARMGPVRVLLGERTTRLMTLTDREREVLDQILSAATTQSIANRLHISPKTVEKHRLNVMAKLHVASISELFKLWLDCTNPGNWSSNN